MSKLTKLSFFVLITLCYIRLGYAQGIENKLQLSLSTGRQQEDLRWSIAGNTNGQSPNVLSELKWKTVKGRNYNASAQWNAWHRFFVWADYSRLNVTSGKVNDMDYSGDNRTSPVYQQNFIDNKGYADAWHTGIGYAVINKYLLSLVPYIGYGISRQSLYILDGSGQFPGLNSSYQTNWKGPFIKVRSTYRLSHALKVTADVTYNQVNYNAQGNWNLINEFEHPVSYRHKAKGYGTDAGAKLIYSFNDYLGIHIGFGYFNWQTGNGNDQLYLNTGAIDKTQLNGVVRSGYQLNGGVVLSL
ncbi:hypothetical protein [Mucilaginibacter sp.]|uniref:hypothetical protein n=1 Tax=Mucilaginibacter sp. TaxID=1882438 RepID=UPI003D0CA372